MIVASFHAVAKCGILSFFDTLKCAF